MNKQSFGTLGSLKLSGDGDLWYVDGDNKLPYICHTGQFYYFAFDGQKYNLVMVSSRDLNVKN